MSRTEPAGTPLGDAFHVYDTTLRDGAQREGISYSVADKLAVARHLDALGVGFIEGGWPGALPKDTEFFARAAAGELELRHAALVAFGSTRKAGLKATEDLQVRALLDSAAPVVTLVAKSDRRHIERALRTDVAENCAMVADTVALLRGRGPAGVPRRRALLRRLPLRPGHARCGCWRRPSTGGRRRRGAVRHQRRHAPAGHRRGGDRGGRAHRLPPRHPLPGRHRLRGGQLGHRGAGRGDARAVHRQRLRRADRQRRSVRRRREPGDQAGHAGPTGRRARRADPHLARVGGDRQHRSRHPPGLCRDVSVRSQGGPARECDQGGPGAVQPHGPGGSSATGSGCWSPRWPAGPASSSRAPSSAWTWPASPTRCRPWWRTVKEREAQGWSFEAADASLELLMRGALGEVARAAVPARVLPGDHRAPGGRRGGRRGHRQGHRRRRAAADRHRRRATARSTRWTPRCGRP